MSANFRESKASGLPTQLKIIKIKIIYLVLIKKKEMNKKQREPSWAGDGMKLQVLDWKAELV